MDLISQAPGVSFVGAARSFSESPFCRCCCSSRAWDAIGKSARGLRPARLSIGGCDSVIKLLCALEMWILESWIRGRESLGARLMILGIWLSMMLLIDGAAALKKKHVFFSCAQTCAFCSNSAYVSFFLRHKHELKIYAWYVSIERCTVISWLYILIKENSVPGAESCRYYPISLIV